MVRIQAAVGGMAFRRNFRPLFEGSYDSIKKSLRNNSKNRLSSFRDAHFLRYG